MEEPAEPPKADAHHVAAEALVVQELVKQPERMTKLVSGCALRARSDRTDRLAFEEGEGHAVDQRKRPNRGNGQAAIRTIRRRGMPRASEPVHRLTPLRRRHSPEVPNPRKTTLSSTKLPSGRCWCISATTNSTSPGTRTGNPAWLTPSRRTVMKLRKEVSGSDTRKTCTFGTLLPGSVSNSNVFSPYPERAISSR